MKTLVLLAVAAGLTGCAVYPAPPYDPYYGVAPAPYVVGPPVYFSGGLYWFDAPGGFYPHGHGRIRPGPLGRRPPQGLGGPGRPERGGGGAGQRPNRPPGNPHRR